MRLRVTIADIVPEIWRTVDVDDSLSLAQLHLVLQVAFGWQDSHLHSFSDDDPWVSNNGIPRIGQRPRVWVDAWSLAESDADGEEDEAATTVGEALKHGGPLWYVYDMGDDWVHRIDLVDRDSPADTELVAQVVAGERRAPFEDSGGVSGYQELSAALADPSRADYRSTMQWVRSSVGLWGVNDLEDADLSGAQGELEALFGPASMDLSGLTSVVASDSPIAILAAELPVPLRSNLRRHLKRTGMLDPVRLDDEDSRELIAAYQWLLERIGEDGITLTQAGWMPPAIVLEGMTMLGWRDAWIGEANREDLTYPMRALRASAQRLRLTRKVKGRLEVVSGARRAIGRPALLIEQVARMLLRQRMTDSQLLAGTLLVLGVADGSITTRRDAERQVLADLGELGYVDAEGRDLAARAYSALVEPVLDVLLAMGLWRDSGRSRDAPPSDALRAFARLALR